MKKISENKKKIKIEWRHLDKQGNTCDRCSVTGENVMDAAKLIEDNCFGGGIVSIDFKETLLGKDKLGESNLILINNIPIEKLLPNTTIGSSSCDSCSSLVGKQVSCRTLRCGNNLVEEIPSSLIYKAACQVLRCC